MPSPRRPARELGTDLRQAMCHGALLGWQPDELHEVGKQLSSRLHLAALDGSEPSH